VITGVTRDDLPDGGASVFARSIRAVHDLPGAPRVEVLIPDYRGAPLAAVLAARPDVLAHNVEVVRRLTPDVRHPRCDYDRSLGTLAESKRIAPDVPTKSSILLGLGETRDEVVATLRDLRGAGADLVVLGQYLRPTRENVEVARYVPPAEFDSLRAEALAIGFAEAVAAPLARTSYRAAEAFARSVRAGGAA
jgi:lipoic acid synthetase